MENPRYQNGKKISLPRNTRHASKKLFWPRPVENSGYRHETSVVRIFWGDLVYETGNFHKISLFFTAHRNISLLYLLCCLGSVSQMSLVVF